MLSTPASYRGRTNAESSRADIMVVIKKYKKQRERKPMDFQEAKRIMAEKADEILERSSEGSPYAKNIVSAVFHYNRNKSNEQLVIDALEEYLNLPGIICRTRCEFCFDVIYFDFKQQVIDRHARKEGEHTSKHIACGLCGETQRARVCFI